MDWSLEQLSAHVAVALQAAPVGPLNGQIAEVPNGRTIRYYTTIGLLDRPRQAGRAALYGRRHLEQLVAIKRLQAQGLPLADIQRQLPALSEAELAALAALPAALEGGEQHGPEVRRASRRDRAFWGAEPSEPSPVPALMDLLPSEPRTDARPVTGITLADGVTLTFPCARPLSADDLEALRAALDGVAITLRARGLLPEQEKEEAP